MKPILPNEALSKGADLWALPLPNQSKWSRRMDWYLNGQLSRAEHHPQPQMAHELLKILKDEEIPIPQHFSSAPLMIASQNLLPNKKTMFVSYDGNLLEWIKKLQFFAKYLRTESFRIFLPQRIQLNEFETFSSHFDISTQIVVDHESKHEG